MQSIRLNPLLSTAAVILICLYFGARATCLEEHDFAQYAKEHVHVWWFAPFLSGGGYCSEAISLVQSLEPLVASVSITHHGDSYNDKFVSGLDAETAQTLRRMSDLRRISLLLEKEVVADMGPAEKEKLVIVCHSEPGAWYPPNYQTSLCPPPEVLSTSAVDVFVVGRTMFETDRIPSGWEERCNSMDKIWVPSVFHKEVFAEYGVDESRLDILHESVDVDFFDPESTSPMSLHDLGCRVNTDQNDSCESAPVNPFIFLSVFKFEERKGWDVLLRSYFHEFHRDDNVLLLILTSAYHSTVEFWDQILEFIVTDDSFAHITGEDGFRTKEEIIDLFPRVCIVGNHIPTRDLPSLYATANAFVLPSRGEGWGRPQVEAMSMALPVIVTNFSGPTEYITMENSFGIPLDELVPLVHPKNGPFQSHLWANPSMEALSSLMRIVFSSPLDAKNKGVRARADMVQRWSPDPVGKMLLQNIRSVCFLQPSRKPFL